MVQQFMFLVFSITGITIICMQENPFQGEDQVLEDVIKELEQFNQESESMWWLQVTADWNYSTNVTSVSMIARTYTANIYSLWIKNWKEWARTTNRKTLPYSVREILDRIASGIIMNSVDARLTAELRSKMTQIYSAANLSIPELQIKAQGEREYCSLMEKTKDPLLLKSIWRSWRLQVGETIQPLFFNLIQLTNQAAQENGYENIGSLWRKELGFQDIVDKSLSLWEEVRIFYKHLHAYTRHKLMLLYGQEHLKNNSFIPVHLLVLSNRTTPTIKEYIPYFICQIMVQSYPSRCKVAPGLRYLLLDKKLFESINRNLWGENWIALENILKPYPDQPSINITENFISESYSIPDLIRKAEEFYVTAGLDPMKPSFWKNSMFLKPNDGRVVDCHPASYDFGINSDYRIRMCAEIKEQSFMEALHEMGHIQYYMAYNHLPMIYHNGPNSAFHEAVGELMVYAAQNPKCLEFMKIGKSSGISNETLLNTLMKQALSKFVLLPWALTVETWRYSLFNGEITEEGMNEAWWTLRKKFQGIEPPDDESAKLFDAGSKYHIINNIPYMRYFIGRFLEHHFLESLCELADEDIHSCCFIEDKTTGKRLKTMLSLGSLVSWSDALEILTGERQLSSRPLLKYYRPLYLWLVDYNSRHNITVQV